MLVDTIYKKQVRLYNKKWDKSKSVFSFKAYIQKYGIFYEKKYDLNEKENDYVFKKNFVSTHSVSLKKIKENSSVLDIGCNQGDLIEYLIEKKNCNVVGLDKNQIPSSSKINEFPVKSVKIT